MKIWPMEAKMFQAGGRAEKQPQMTKLIVASAILRKRLKKSDKQYNPS